jgi:uncharacterized protein YbgA (DUF1722 family)
MGFVKKLEPFVEFLPICPEVEIGLGIPRDPIKLVERNQNLTLVQPFTDKDLTKTMRKFAHAYLKSLKDIDGFVLKYGSPSCGINSAKIYPAKDNPIPIRKGSGMFSSEVMSKSGSFSKLVNFQTDNKLLLMAYSQKHMRELGKVVAYYKKSQFKEAVTKYEECLAGAFKRNAKYTSHINVIMHALGYFKKDICSNEKKYFLKMLERYRDGKVPLSAVLSILQSWIIKYDKEYLHSQTYFNPYPEELIEITDSGKGRNL